MHAHGALEPGTLLAERYRVDALVGAGGMAAVYRATDEVLGRPVAVKVLAGGHADPAAAQRERAELQLLASLDHRALVTLFDAAEAHVDAVPVTCLVMELVDGPSLATRLAEGPIEADEVAAMALDLSQALAVVHEHGVVHRDVKPANILLGPSPGPGRAFSAKLADFGIAALVDSTRITATGTVLGSAGYLSPEQTSGQRVGPPADVYSLGLVLLEALTGRQEFEGPLLEAVSARLVRDPVIPVSLGAPWTALLAAMTARDPEARPTAAEVAARLHAAPASGPDAALPLAVETAAIATPTDVAGIVAASTSPLPTAARPVASGDDAATRAVPVGAASLTAGTAATDDDAPPAAPLRKRRKAAWIVAAGAVVAVAAGGAAVAMTSQQAPAEGEVATSQTPEPPTATASAPPGAPTETDEPGRDEPAAPTSEAPSPTPTPTPTPDAPAPTTPAEPAPTEPAPVEPAPTEPAPVDPAPVEPAPAAPAPEEPAPGGDTGTAPTEPAG
ncbi:protein kinase [Agrococcus terreus]|uniref:serine/threonine-protein kinase n=1 Tax=Agrococcus terreus TaxID=574649 RepID=UPI00384FA52E